MASQTPIITDLQARAENALAKFLPAGDLAPSRLLEAMRYSTLGGGKRMRPLLTYGTGLALGLALDSLDSAACAVEIIHAYSLIHDDLPAMDNDELRRGKATCHIAFGEAEAILAGDALQALAFEVLAGDTDLHPQARCAMMLRLAQACGPHGMAGGQAIDLASVGKPLGEAELDRMHQHKTGALMLAAVMLAADAVSSYSKLSPKQLQQLQQLQSFGADFGLAFQIQDDILDVEGDTATLGKPQGSDAARGKPTYPSAIGMAASKARVTFLKQRALDALADFGKDAEALRSVVYFAIGRRF